MLALVTWCSCGLESRLMVECRSLVMMKMITNDNVCGTQGCARKIFAFDNDVTSWGFGGKRTYCESNNTISKCKFNIQCTAVYMDINLIETRKLLRALKYSFTFLSVLLLERGLLRAMRRTVHSTHN